MQRKNNTEELQTGYKQVTNDLDAINSAPLLPIFRKDPLSF